MKKLLTPFIFLAIGFYACNDSSVSPNNSGANERVVEEDEIFADSLKNDASCAPFAIISKRVEGKYLLVEVEYTGCSNNKFSVYWTNPIVCVTTPCAPQKMELLIEQKAYEVTCQAIVNETLKIDLSSEPFGFDADELAIIKEWEIKACKP
jgi:hypothetical protein